MYENAQYIAVNGQNVAISAQVNGVLHIVPLDPANSDYAAIMQLVAEGKLTIAEAS
jgi:hypothetical protein